MYLPEKGYQRILVLTFYVALGILISYFFFRYLFIGLLPFFLGWVFAYLMQPALNFLHKKAHIPKKLSMIVIVLMALAVLSFLVFLIFNRIVVEFNSIYDRITYYTNNMSDITGKITNWIDRVFADMPFINSNDIVDNFIANIDSNLMSLLQTTSPFLVSFVKSIVTTVPYTLVFILITVIATCYLAIDFKRVNAFVTAQFSDKPRQLVIEVKNQFFSTTFKYFRAYMLLMLITFTELFVGFSIIGIDYAFLLALLVALIDIFPILGTGTILVPWILIELLNHDYRTGIALLVLYGTITLVRQIIEPKVVGTYIGLYPLVTLIALYLGVRIMGLGGIFVFPILAIIIKNLNDKGFIHLFKQPDKEKGDDLEETKLKFKQFKKNKKQ